jgi:hypothetical protein
MPPADAKQRQLADSQQRPPLGCDACQSALSAGGRDALSFLLVDHLTVPLVGCEDHLEQFAGVCGHTTVDTAQLLQHQPAGGITCPGCRNARHTPSQPMIAVEDGAVAVLACPDHQTDILDRFRTGLETQQQLTATLDTQPQKPTTWD